MGTTCPPFYLLLTDSLDSYEEQTCWKYTTCTFSPSPCCMQPGPRHLLGSGQAPAYYIRAGRCVLVHVEPHGASFGMLRGENSCLTDHFYGCRMSCPASTRIRSLVCGQNIFCSAISSCKPCKHAASAWLPLWDVRRQALTGTQVPHLFHSRMSAMRTSHRIRS